MYESSNTNIHLNAVVYKEDLHTSNKQPKVSITNRKTGYNFNFKDMTCLNKQNKKIIFNDEKKHENGHIKLNNQKEQECCEPIEME